MTVLRPLFPDPFVIPGYALVDQLYLDETAATDRRISSEEMQSVLLDQAMQLYDSASNGNRTRGSMKKASDL